LHFAESVDWRAVLREGWETTSATRLPLTLAATGFAERAHAGQLRGDGTPFIRHPLEVASLLHRSGAPDQVIAAGVLHDVIEKTNVTVGELTRRFGLAIARLVLAVTDDEEIAVYADRKAALCRQVATAGHEALAIFAADKLSKLRELRREAAADRAPGGTSVWMHERRARRLRHYRHSLAMLQERVPESPLVHQLAAELGALLDDPEVALVA
jgi:(p)ppGpp synthase/HD superfamily hydrolase